MVPGKNRIMITPSAAALDAIERISTASKIPKSRIVSDILETQVDALGEWAALAEGVLRTRAKLTDGEKARLLIDLTHAEAHALDRRDSAMDNLSDVRERVEELAPDEKRARRAPPQGSATRRVRAR